MEFVFYLGEHATLNELFAEMYGVLLGNYPELDYMQDEAGSIEIVLQGFYLTPKKKLQSYTHVTNKLATESYYQDQLIQLLIK